MQQTVFITGISAGLGHGLAIEYLQQQAVVYGISRRKPEINESQNLCYHCVDLQNVEQLEAKITEAIQGVAHFDMVILNAADMGVVEDLIDTDIRQLQRIANINLWSNKIICDAIFKAQIKVAQIVAISSGAAVNPQRGGNGYAITKAALNMLMQIYAREQPQTHFCSFAPGLIDTAMQEYLCNHPQPQKFPMLEQLRRAKGTPHMPSPQQAAQFLITKLPTLLHFASGSYIDIRDLSE